ncbi:GatB/YqeY domain-containing protein [Raineyella fluvialis]|uniref:GatB/YqeY domain-containing protein n=1 Tax=Raineyella fluvialis TaxID=2662261 RepID=A0A5Q2FBZ2_9ACTN|nr:GatB/YqeY domain-containing protein [Raineyella fluvialis]QGF23911.1 GatB/YqeY domain-containing protein [Raineyella fluvialis]
MAELKDRLRADMKVAMKAHDQQRLGTIRMALAAIANAEVEGTAHELTAEEEQRLLTKEVRQRRDSAETYTQGGRQDLVEKELAEAEILQAYLPQPMTSAEVEALIDAEFAAIEAETGEAPTMKQMGTIMKAVNARIAGRFDGGAVAGLVKGRLANK